MSVYVQRFNNMIRALEESPAPHRFTMGAYGHEARANSPLPRDQNPCGTPACVLGHYAYRTDLQSIFWLDNGSLMEVGGEEGVDLNAPTVLEHFGITEKEAYQIFSHVGCDRAVTAPQAVKYLRAFMARKWPAPNWTELAMQSLPQLESVS